MGLPKQFSSRPTCISPTVQGEKGAFAPPPEYLKGSLVDPRFDSDSCGVGFVAQLSAEPSHAILVHALTALGRLAHRGAVAADGKSSDGVGIMTAVPRTLLLESMGLNLEKTQQLGVGMLFLPAEETRAEAALEQCIAAQEMKVLGWRD